MTLQQSAVRRAIEERNTYRLMLQIALRQWGESERRADRLREQLAELREERERLAQQIFGSQEETT